MDVYLLLDSQYVLQVLLTNLRMQERQSCICSTIAMLTSLILADVSRDNFSC